MWYFVRLRFFLFALALAATHHACQAQQTGLASFPDYAAGPQLPAGSCCIAPPQENRDWMFHDVTAAAGHPNGVLKQNPLAGYAAGHHLRFMPAWRSLPTGLADRPDRPAGSLQVRTAAYSQVGAGASYRLSPTLRATTNWATGVGPYSVSPGSQFTLGVAVKY